MVVRENSICFILKKEVLRELIIIRSGYKGNDNSGGGYYSRRSYPMLNLTVIFNRIKEVLNGYKAK